MTRTPFAAALGGLVALGGAVLAAPALPVTGKTTGGVIRLVPDAPKNTVRMAGPRGAAYVIDPVAGEAAPGAPEPANVVLLRARQLELFALQGRGGYDPQGPAPPVLDGKLPDTYDLFVFGPTRPVRIRVALSYDGKPVVGRWQGALKKAFAYFDRDGDGYLNPFEAQFIFGDTGLAVLMQNGFFSPAPQDRPTIEKLDRDGDRRVSFDEFAAYYRQAAGFAMRAQPPVAENPNNAQVTQSLFKLLDTNGDGKLTRDELRAAEKLIASRDNDEDECLSAAELLPNQFAGRGVRVAPPVPARPNGMPATSPTATAVTVVYQVGKVPGTVTQRLLKQYDKDGDFELTRAESGFDSATFTRLDTDGDGKLSGEELDAWRTGTPDLEVSMSLAATPADCRTDLLTPAKVAEERGFTARHVETGRLTIRSGRQTIDLWAFTGVFGPGRVVTIKQQFAFLFQQAAGTKGYVEEKDLMGQAGVQFQQLKVMFDPADRNGDGRLTRAEFDAYLDVQQNFVDIGLSLTPAVQTPTLFQLLDDNRDGRLGVRELRTSWDRLILLEAPGATEVTASAILPSVTLRFSRSMERNQAFQPVQVQFVGGNPNAAPPVPQKGPVWFRKMDRNGDGDLSRSEFLGTGAEFDAIDTDHDGLISLEEAEAFEKKTRSGVNK